MDTWEVVCKEKGGRYANDPETKNNNKKKKPHQKTSTKTNNNN